MATKQKEGGKEEDFLIDWSKSNEEIINEYNKLYGTNKTHILMSSNEPVGGGFVDMGAARQYTELVGPSGKVDKTFLRVPKISLDKNTGDIHVAGPSRIINSNSFRSQVNPLLESMSKAYKTDPNSSFPVLNAHGDETGATENIDEMIERLNSSDPNQGGSMGYFADAIYKLDNIKKHDKDNYGININIRDEDMGLRTSVFVDSPDGTKPKDTDRQAVSDAIGEKNLKKLATYDPVTRTAEYKDIKDNLWNRELGDTDEELRAMRKLVQDRILANKYEDSEEGSKQAASDIAFLEFLYGEKPNMAWYRGVVEGVGEVVRGVLDSSTEFAQNAARDISNLTDVFNHAALNITIKALDLDEDQAMIAKGLNTLNLANMSNPVSVLIDGLDVMAWSIDDKPRLDDEHFWNEEAKDYLKEIQEIHEEEIEFLPAGAKTAGKVANGLTDMLFVIGASKIAGNLTTAALGSASGAIASAGEKASGFLANALKAGAGSAEGINKVSSVVRALDLIGRGSAKVLSGIANFTASALNHGAVTNSTRILAESLAECYVLDPELTRELLASGGLSTEARNMLFSDIVENVGGEMVGLAAGKALVKAGKTAVGEAVSHNLSTWVKKRQVKFGALHNKMRVKLHGADSMADYIERLASSKSVGKQKKAQAVLANQVSLINNEILSNADYIKIIGKNADELKAGNKAYAKQIAKYYENENLINDIARRNIGYINDLTVGERNIEFRTANEAFNDSYSKLLKLEQEAGIAPAKALKNGMPVLLSQETVNYVSATSRVDFINRYIAKYEGQDLSDSMVKKLKDAASEKEYWEDYISEYRVNHSQEMVAAADDLVTKNREWSRTFNNACIQDRTLDPVMIASLKNSGLWGEDGSEYMHIQRKNNEDEIGEWMFGRRDQRAMRSTALKDEHYTFGSKADFEDQFLVTFKKLNKQAEVYNRTTLLRNLSQARGGSVLISGDNVKFAKAVKESKGGFERAMKKQMEDIAKFSKEPDISTAQAEMSDSAKALKNAQDNLAHQTNKANALMADTTSAGNKFERQGVIMNSTEEELDDIWNKVFGASSVDEYMQALNTNPKSIPAPVRSMLKERYNEMVTDDIHAAIHMPFQEGTPTAHVISELSSIREEKVSSKEIKGVLATVVGKDNADKIVDALRRGKRSKYVTKSSLPKLDRQSFYKLTGTNNKTVPKEIKPFLSNHGVKFDNYDDIVNQIPSLRKKAGEKITFTEKDVIRYYKEVSSQANPNEVSIDEVIEYLKSHDMDDELDKALRGPDVRTRAKDRVEHGDITYDQYVELVARDDTLNKQVKRMALANDEDVLKSPELKEATGAQIRADHAYQQQMAFDNAAEAEREAREAFNISAQAMDDSCDFVYDMIMEQANNSDEIKNFINSLVEKFPRVKGHEEEVLKYYVLEHINKHMPDVKKSISGSVERKINATLKRETGSNAGALAARDHIANRVMAKFEDEFGQASAVMQDICPDLVDQETIFGFVKDICDHIDEYETHNIVNGVVGIANDKGQLEYIKVDPLLSIFARSSEKMTEMGKIEKANYLWMKSFRLGTTTLSIRSAMRQTFTDTANAYIGSGWFFQSTKQLMNEAYTVLGDDVVDFIRSYDPSLAEKVVRGSVSEKEAFKEAFGSATGIGKDLAAGSTETAQYKLGKTYRNKEMAQRYGRVDHATLGKVGDNINGAIDKLGFVNEYRERFLRNATYQRAYSDAVKKGLSHKSAVEYAKFVQSNATTDFSKTMEHLTALQRTVPYLGAAVNGTKSFFRLASLDPVGVFGRLFGGIGVPMMYLTARSLSNEEDRKIWKNLKEYQKDGNIVFVSNGQVFTIPIPPEIGAFVNPFRQMVEAMYDANEHTFWELAANDMIGLSPIELDGFINLDNNSLKGDNNLLNNVPAGITKVWSQLAPAPLKSAMMAITHIDPYTMTNVDTHRVVVNYDTKEIEVMDNRAGAFSQKLAEVSLMHNLGISASLAEKLLQNIIGIAGVDAADWLTNMAVGITDDGWSGAGEALVGGFEVLAERLSDPLTVTLKNKADSEWNRAVYELREEKEAILKSEEYAAYMKKARMVYRDGDPEEILSLKYDRDRILGQFFEDVMEITTNLKEKYPESYTADKYASVLALMTVDTPAGDYSSTRGQDLLQNLHYDAQQRAIGTMREMGFPDVAPEDSLLGGYYTNPYTGEVEREKYTATDLRDMQNKLWHTDTLHQSNLSRVLEDNGINRGAMFEGYSDLNRLEKKAYKKAWNSKVVTTIAPYMQKYGVQNVLSDSGTRDMLDDILFVDGQWKADQYLKEIFEGE